MAVSLARISGLDHGQLEAMLQHLPFDVQQLMFIEGIPGSKWNFFKAPNQSVKMPVIQLTFLVFLKGFSRLVFIEAPSLPASYSRSRSSSFGAPGGLANLGTLAMRTIFFIWWCSFMWKPWKPEGKKDDTAHDMKKRHVDPKFGKELSSKDLFSVRLCLMLVLGRVQWFWCFWWYQIHHVLLGMISGNWCGWFSQGVFLPW